MKRVAILGNAGGGKSTLALRLSERYGIPRHHVDQLQFRPRGAGRIDDAEFARVHDAIIAGDSWIIDGFGTYETYVRRLELADTIIFVDLPIWRHYWWTAKRNLSSIFATPLGFPERPPLLRASVQIAKFIWWVHRNFTPVTRSTVARYAATKNVHHIRSVRELRQFSDTLGER